MAKKTAPSSSAVPQKESSVPAEKRRPIHTGHRERMRHRVKNNGLESLAEHEMLEYLLFFVLPRQDTNPIAHALLERFHTFANVLEATEEELQTVKGIGPSAAEFLHTLFEVHRYCEKSGVGVPKRLADTEQIAAYIVPMFRGKKQEQLLLLAQKEKRLPHSRLMDILSALEDPTCHAVLPLLNSAIETDMMKLMNERAKALADEKRRITEQIELIADADRDVRNVIDLSEEWKTASYEKKKSVVHLLIDKIYIAEDGAVEVVWNI